MKYIEHTFGPTETIDAIILLKNQHDMNASEELDMRSWYNALNNAKVPRQGETCNIPILARHEHVFGELVKTR